MKNRASILLILVLAIGLYLGQGAFGQTVIKSVSPKEAEAMEKYVEKEKANEKAARTHAEAARNWRAQHPQKAFLLDLAIAFGTIAKEAPSEFGPIFSATDPVGALELLIERDMKEGKAKREILRLLSYGGIALSVNDFASTYGVDMFEATLSFLGIVQGVTDLEKEEALYWKVGSYPKGQERNYLRELLKRLPRAMSAEEMIYQFKNTIQLECVAGRRVGDLTGDGRIDVLIKYRELCVEHKDFSGYVFIYYHKGWYWELLIIPGAQDSPPGPYGELWTVFPPDYKPKEQKSVSGQRARLIRQRLEKLYAGTTKRLTPSEISAILGIK